MGSQDSATAQSLLDATERVLQSRGYPAVSSQSVADEAGVKRQLIFYYYQNIEDMILAAFSRRMARTLEKIKQAGQEKRPVHAIWDIYQDAFDAKLVFEYTALAGHNEEMRLAMAAFVKSVRKENIKVIKKAYAAKNIEDSPVPPDVAAFLINCITMSLVRESGTGINMSHRAVRNIAKMFLDTIE
jgi:AcrR family transcriptional regulator